VSAQTNFRQGRKQTGFTDVNYLERFNLTGKT
jgi:hypothetical protein